MKLTNQIKQKNILKEKMNSGKYSQGKLSG